eukprot:TRINITY_DN60531_c0_g1_i1.p2 TRINITY_DN60531_c0_g1~~TRINITY_DN60531_c0_g1_i1.p2  ORF type:complete len:194 (-),score=23.34 TRINITY_DN60531_c0_g1_i1:21-602(-)
MHGKDALNPFISSFSNAQYKRTVTWAPQIVKRASTILPNDVQGEDRFNRDRLARVLRDSMTKCDMLEMVEVLKKEKAKVDEQNQMLQVEKVEEQESLDKLVRDVTRQCHQLKSPSFIKAISELHQALQESTRLKHEVEELRDEGLRLSWRLRAEEASLLLSAGVSDTENEQDTYNQLSAQLTLLMFAGLVKCN